MRIRSAIIVILLLVKHFREVHDGKQNWNCDICNISFNSKFDLGGHEGKQGHLIKKSNWPESVHDKTKEKITRRLRTVPKDRKNDSS